MCGRLSQYSGIHDFVAALSMPNALPKALALVRKSHGITYQERIHSNWYSAINMSNRKALNGMLFGRRCSIRETKGALQMEKNNYGGLI